MKSVKGFKDYLPEEAARLTKIETIAREVFSSFGYGEIRIPVLEPTELFARGIGEATDIVEKEMYTFIDRDDQSLSLRPEGTAGTVRAYIQNGLAVSRPKAKLFYMGPMFRRERPQKGRFRQFYQLGSEAFGSESPSLDAEVVAMINALLIRLGLKNLELLINSVGCAECRPPYKEKLTAYLKGLGPDKLCGNCVNRIDKNPLRVLDCKQESCRSAIKNAPSITDNLCSGCREHFDAVMENLGAMGVKYTVEPHLVRGLDYYTRTAFEFVSDEIGAQSAVAAGGRYDGLVKELGGPEVPGIGFAAGMERIALHMKEEDVGKGPDIYIAPMGKEASLKAMELALHLREAGLWVETEHEPKNKFNALLKKANKLNAGSVLIIGEDELKKGLVGLKNLKTGKQIEIKPDELVKNPGKFLSD